MKLRAAIMMAILFPGLAWPAEGDFLTNVPADRARIAGLDTLNAEQRRELEALVELYKDGQLRQLKQAAEKQAAEAEAKVKVAEAKAAEAAGKKSQPGWLGSLVGSGDKTKAPKREAVESRLTESFWGWDGATIFRLENGQVWQQAIPGEFYQLKKPITSARVKVYPGIMGYLLEVIDTGASLKVKPLIVK
jgi:hypothetical protein